VNLVQEVVEAVVDDWEFGRHQVKQPSGFSKVGGTAVIKKGSRTYA
jgi:hypothetical protein